MSNANANAERAKFGYLLQLAHEQIQALETEDYFAFDRILAARQSLIGSLRDVRAQINADSTVATVVAQIQDADKTAQRLLFRKLGRIMRELNTLRQYQKARVAYQGNEPLPATLHAALAAHLSEASFMDRQG